MTGEDVQRSSLDPTDPRPPAFNDDGGFSLDFLEWANREGKRRADQFGSSVRGETEQP